MRAEGKLTLSRTSQFFNKARKFKIFLDNVHVEDIRDGEEIVIPITEGEHEVYIKLDWARSKVYKFRMKDGDDLSLRCGCPLTGKKMLIPFIELVATFVPGWYLFIEQQEDSVIQ
ncbi:MAG: hypothetical protein LRY71_10060 [Bacillaceae bacterium]|nr:hypothetical protein [Bacillaceae bacterium]